MVRRSTKQVIYFLIPVLFFIIFFARTQTFTHVKFAVIKTFSIPIRLVSVPLKEVKKIVYYHRTFNEYVRLRKETDSLKARLVGLEEVIRENTRFGQLLEFKRRLVYSSVAANVIGREPSQWNASMIVDKGSEDGIKQGMPVVNAQGVVGKIAEVGAKESKVILVIDPQFSVAALVQRHRESGLVSGTLQGKCRMTYLNASAKVNIGDTVITSKLSSSFPESLVIGEVIDVYPNPQNGSIECVIEPAVSLSQIEEVLIIKIE